jgi:hypothetical protein
MAVSDFFIKPSKIFPYSYCDFKLWRCNHVEGLKQKIK